MPDVRRIVGGIVVAALCAACGGLLPDRTVHVVRPIEGPVGDDQPNRRLVALPAPGASPVDIVNGFLDAQGDAEDGHAAARQFLAPRASWTPTSGVMVYAGKSGPVRESTTGDRIVYAVRFSRRASVSPAGEYSTAAATVTQRFVVSRAGVEWRLSQVPRGLTLTFDDLQRGFRRTVLYFLNRGETKLVRQPLYLPREELSNEQLAVRALLAGPAGRTGIALRTAIPERTELIGATVEGGVADLNVSRELNDAPPRAVQALLAQIVWTLTELPGISAIRLQVEGEQYPVPGASPGSPIRREVAGRLDPGDSP
ncbi:MAG: GerMN domain-containing protein [Mycobacteriales bacterium]|nr:GerMN domain-containing protein [Frankia sp.]